MRSGLAAAIGSCAALLTAPALPATPASLWPELARRDLIGIHDIIRDNHPGPVDPENPHFRDWLEGGLVKASAKAKVAQSYSDYIRALRLYTNGFRDGHLSIDPVILPFMPNWAGFALGAGPDGAPEVVSAEPDSGVKIGDRIESCDGQSFDVLMKSRTDPYFWNRDIPQARMNWVSMMLVANPDEYDSRLKSCRFSSGQVKLNWRSLRTDELNRKLVSASSGTNNDFSLKQVGGLWFVHLPRFYFKSDDDRKNLEGLIEELKAKAPELQKAIVVFDVRGNGGGDSLWGHRIAAALWGEAWTNRVEASFDNSQDVRVSAANIHKWAEIHDMIMRQKELEALPYWNMVEAAMEKARAAGKALAYLNFPPSALKEPPPVPVSGRMFLLTDSGCGSACLSFADLMLHLPGVVQVGGPTFADAVYIDANELPLPSGLTNLNYGMKVMRGSVRGNNQWYEPKYRWPGGEMTDEALAKWVNSLPPADGSGPIIAGGAAPRAAAAN